MGDIVSSPIYIYQQFTVFMYYHQLYRLNPLNHADDFQNVNVTTTLIIYLFHRKCNLEISFFNNPNQLKQKSPMVPPRISDGGHDLVNNTTFLQSSNYCLLKPLKHFLCSGSMMQHNPHTVQCIQIVVYTTIPHCVIISHLKVTSFSKTSTK